jgi:hypothetical protein
MKTLNVHSWDKASTIYRWNILLTIIATWYIVPRLVPIGTFSNILGMHIQWRALILFPSIYLIFTFLPLLVAAITEFFISLFSKKYSLNSLVDICYVVWILQGMLVLAGAFDVWFFGHEHHIPALFSQASSF